MRVGRYASEPQLEHVERPELCGVVAPAARVLVEQHVDVARRDYAAAERGRVREGVADLVAQLRIDPLGDRDAKALLRPVEDLVGHEPTHGALEDALRLAAAQLERRWDA